jgi:hypothetical protein
MRANSNRAGSGHHSNATTAGEMSFGTGPVSPSSLSNDNKFGRRNSQSDGRAQDAERSKELLQRATPSQFLFINESSVRPRRQHRQAVRSHVMQRFHTSRREKNNLAPKKHQLQQRRNSNSHTNPSPSVSRDTLSPTNQYIASEPTLDSELPINDWYFKPSLALYSDELSKCSTQGLHEASLGAFIPTSRLYNLANHWSFDTCMYIDPLLRMLH